MHCSKFMLVCIAFGLGAVSLTSMALAISTDHWLLLLEERLISSFGFFQGYEMASENLTIINIPRTMNISSKIGLWRFCVLSVVTECVALDYSSSLKKREKNDEQETTTAIAEAQREATPVFLTGFFLVLCSTLCNVVGNIRGNTLTLMAAVFYINAGLCIAVGMILYITFINDETSHAKKSDDLIFMYSYGWSAYLVGLCFFASEFAAVLCITIFIKKFPNSEDKVKIVPGLERKLSVPTDCHSNPTIVL